MLRTLPLAVLAALLLCAPAAHATFKGGNGRIAYQAKGGGIADNGDRTAYRAVATVQPDSRADRFLRECQEQAGKATDGDCAIQYRTPVWRPDARQLAFDAGRQLALISPAGTGLSLLPAVTADDSEPAWAPDGRRLAFAGGGGIYVYDLRARRARRIVTRGADPDWSSKNRIAFERGGSVYTVTSTGRGLKRVARGKDPGWSASGKALILARRGGIYTVAPDGKRLKRVLRCSRCAAPVFSPDGKLFAYNGADLEVARLSDGRRLLSLVRNFNAGGESFTGSNPSWARR